MAQIGGFSIIQFSFVSFFSVLMSNRLTEPNMTDLCRLTETMILAEPVPNQKLLKDVHWIYNHVDDEIDINLAQLEMLVFYQLSRGSGLNKEIEINGKNYKVVDLYKYLDLVNQKLIKIVVELGKLYNLEVPIGIHQQGGKLIL